MRMPPVERSPSAPSLQLPGRRLLSRLTSQFGSKTRNLQDFYITVDHPHKQYSPGDRVSGSVHLRLHKPVRITHLAVCLHGFVQVYKNPGVPPADGYRAGNVHVGTGRGSRSGEYFGNGFASLFEDESILCGDGRLDARPYQFNFILEFPDWDLPSSISFERGTISYMITATLTRNQTISPISQCDHKVYLVERIDISLLLPPKPRTITLEPLSRRVKAKTQARRLVENDRRSRKVESNSARQSNDRRGSQTSSSPSLHAAGADNAHSPAPSEMSLDSLTGSQGLGSQQGSNITPWRSNDLAMNGSKTSLPVRPIIAEVESLNGGCLRGDQIPIRVRVDHTKHVKSLHGVIVTLYRQARVDMHPAIPVGPVEKGKEAKYEDYYPRSITGLGGLSLSGAGSSHTFRKDLSQTIVPLIIDPVTLSAEVTSRVHVPDDVFPTISTVPGAMISFRYYVEVVLDIQGKLSTQDRNLGNLGGLASTIHQGQLESEPSASRPLVYPIIDTAALRRDKGVVACTFEIVVGTKDSDRRKEKQKAEAAEAGSGSQQRAPEQTQERQEIQIDPFTGPQCNRAYHGDQWFSDQESHDYQDYDAASHEQHDSVPYNAYYDEPHQTYAGPLDTVHRLPAVDMPRVEDESGLSEKERMKRAERRLLPSQPSHTESQSVEVAQMPTAPVLPHIQQQNLHDHPHAIWTPSDVAASSSRNTGGTPSLDYANDSLLPRTRTYEPRGGELPSDPARNACESSGYASSDPNGWSSQSTVAPPVKGGLADDKRDLEWQRMRLQASAPGEDQGEGHVWAVQAPAPSAPVLDAGDDMLSADIHDSHADAYESIELPRYER